MNDTMQLIIAANKWHQHDLASKSLCNFLKINSKEMLIMVVNFTDFHKKKSPPSDIFKTHNFFL